MGKKVFVPLTDELLYDHPELINGPLLPYAAGRPCYHWLAVELNPADAVPRGVASRTTRRTFPQWLAAFKLPALDKASRGEAPSLLSP